MTGSLREAALQDLVERLAQHWHYSTHGNGGSFKACSVPHCASTAYVLTALAESDPPSTGAPSREATATALGAHLHQKGVGCDGHRGDPAVRDEMHRDDAYDIVDFLAASKSPSDPERLDVERLGRAIASLAHGRCCWEPEQDARDVAAEYARLNDTTPEP